MKKQRDMNWLEYLNYHRLLRIERRLEQIDARLQKKSVEAEFRAALTPTVEFLERLAANTKPT